MTEVIQKKIKKGEEFFVHLPGMKLSGYSWKWNQEKDGVAQVKEENADKDDVVGGSPGVKFQVKGVKIGKTRLEFNLRRDWEKKEAAEDQRIYVIEVV